MNHDGAGLISRLEGEKVIPIEASQDADALSAVGMLSLSADTIRRRYANYIVQLSERRQGMQLKNVLKIAAGTAEPA
jgi:hypothetical protein